ncbi:CRP-like cAMP-binding protein [Aliiruegeria haliotis]|uniref:CRP-like cAMP-binding protein n=1 Tax=Aliiruegeria haliotis TaxID=1280846 RepID=A0A2T0RLZ1_9RHOB|nr:Crp/Fnr family transcriptional regulator [Aliiruegeria haliotis]PRY22151.1 CRP-like cAMP-binding protein [Aliiruegeria haliotis]
MKAETDCAACPLRKFALFEALDENDEEATRRFKDGERRVDPGTILMHEGMVSEDFYTVLSGMGLRYKTTPDGKRQVINFVLPGDFIGLQSGLMSEMKHSVETTTRMHLCRFKRSSLLPFMRNNPGRAFDVTWLSAVEENLVAEALVSIGQQPAATRLAWALHRLYTRISAVGADLGPGRIPLPYTQQDMADALGLSLVHTNRILRLLQTDGMISWRDKVLTVHDERALANRAGMTADMQETIPRRPLI